MLIYVILTLLCININTIAKQGDLFKVSISKYQYKFLFDFSEIHLVFTDVYKTKRSGQNNQYIQINVKKCPKFTYC